MAGVYRQRSVGRRRSTNVSDKRQESRDNIRQEEERLAARMEEAREDSKSGRTSTIRSRSMTREVLKRYDEAKMSKGRKTR